MQEQQSLLQTETIRYIKIIFTSIVDTIKEYKGCEYSSVCNRLNSSSLYISFTRFYRQRKFIISVP